MEPKKNKKRLIEVPKYQGIFQKYLLTVNFATPYHIDQADGDTITHCSYSLPNKWIKDNNTNSVFAIGKKLIDISKKNLTISFLPKHSFHATGIPNNVAKTFPESLVGQKSIQSVLADKDVVRKYLAKSVIAWGGWDHYRK